MPSVDPPPKASGRKSLLTLFLLTSGSNMGGTTGAANSIAGALAGEATAREATAGEATEVREAMRIRFIGVMLCGLAFHRTS